MALSSTRPAGARPFDAMVPCSPMKTRAAVLRAMGLPLPYAQSRPLAIETVELEPPGAG